MRPSIKGFVAWNVIALAFHLCQTLCAEETSQGGNTYVDLSHEFDKETIYWLTTKPFEMTVIHNGTPADKNYWYQLEEISAGTHVGTHMDAPCHFALGRWCVSDVPLEKLILPAVVVDISSQVQNDSNVHLDDSHLTSWEKQNGRIPDGSLLMIRTGWAKFWPDRLAYTGTNERDVKLLKFPSVKPEAARWLVDHRRIAGIAIDSMSQDIPNSPRPSTHTILAEENIYGIENVNDNLQLLPPTGSVVYVMPMKLKDASGAPCRVFASLPKNAESSASCTTSRCYGVVFIASVFGVYVLWAKST